MDHKVLLEDSQIREAWKLFVSKGILKRDVLRDDITFSWTRLRLSGLDPNHEKVYFEKKPLEVDAPNFALSEQFSLWLQEYQCNLYILNEYNQVISKFVYSHDSIFMAIDRGTLLAVKGNGEFSCHLPLEINCYSKVIGHEHYLKLFHQTADLCFKFEAQDKHYKAWLTTSISNFTSDIAYNFDRFMSQASRNVYIDVLPVPVDENIEAYISSFTSSKFILEVNSNGEITTSVYLDSQFIDKGQSVFKYFKSVKLSDILNEKCFLTRLNVNEGNELVLIECLRHSENRFSLYGKATDQLSSITKHIAGLVNTDTRALCVDTITIDPDVDQFYKRLSEGFPYALIKYHHDNDFLVLSESLSRQLSSKGKRNSCFVVVECSYYTHPDLKDKLFGNEEEGIIGILEWIGSGVVALKNFEKTDSKFQMELFKWLTLSSNKNTSASVIVGLSINEVRTSHKLVNGLEELLKVTSCTLKSYKEMPMLFKKAIKNDLVKRGLNTSEIVDCLLLLDDYSLEAYNYDLADISEYLTRGTLNRELIKRKRAHSSDELCNATLKEVEIAKISTVLQENNYNYAKTALALGISRSTLYRKLKSMKD